MKITYFNDDKKPLYVTINQFGNGKTIYPLGQKTFDIDVPEGYNLFIKSWDYGTVFISAVKEEESDGLRNSDKPE